MCTGQADFENDCIKEGLDTIKSGLTQLENELETDDITEGKEKQFKKNFEDLTEGASELEELEKEEEKQSSSSSTPTSSESTLVNDKSITIGPLILKP